MKGTQIRPSLACAGSAVHGSFHTWFDGLIFAPRFLEERIPFTCVFPFVAALLLKIARQTRTRHFGSFRPASIGCSKQYPSKRQSEKTADRTPKGFKCQFMHLS